MTVLESRSDEELAELFRRAVVSRTVAVDEPYRSVYGQWCLDILAEIRRREARASDDDAGSTPMASPPA